MDEQERKEYICADCGRVINEDELANCLRGEDEDGEEIIICPDCREEWAICAYCGKLERKDYMTQAEDTDNYFCDDCVDELYYCDRCGAYSENAETTEVVVDDYGHTENWCEDCVSDNAWTCEDCDTIFSNDVDGEEIRGSGRYVCRECAREDYYYCEECDSYVDYDDWDDDYDCCRWCAEDRGDRRIGDYHEAPYQQLYGKIQKSWQGRFRGIGSELEISKPERRYEDEAEFLDGLEEYYDTDGQELYFERDGSLEYGGIEIITQPHTIEEYFKMDWSNILKTCKEHGYKSHDAGCCGLHFHFSREMFGATEYKQSLALAKILMMFEKNREDIQKISRRKSMCWCAFNNLPTDNTKANRQRFMARARERYNDHGTIVNTGNRATIEFRMFRGTLNEKSFWASADFLVNIVKNARAIKWEDVGNIQMWLKGMKPETLEYIASRHAFESVLANITTQDEENYIEEVA